jgi:hypothetical protein
MSNVQPSICYSVLVLGSHILEYAQQLLDGTLPPTDEYGRPNPKPNKIFSRERLIQHMEKCSESYILRSDPRRFLSQFELFESVSGSDNIAVSIEVRSRLLLLHGRILAYLWSNAQS